MRLALAAIVMLACLCLTGESRGAGVDLEVILAADVSRSIDDAEFDLQRKGYAAASMNDLCEAMGVRSPSLYAAFESKEALYLAAIEHYVQRGALSQLHFFAARHEDRR